jgi:hypothetical protein
MIIRGGGFPRFADYRPVDEARSCDEIQYRGSYRKTGRVPKAWKVLFDPVPVEDGGYKPGSEFLAAEILHMLDLGVISLGTIFERGGLRYTFIGYSQLKDQHGEVWKPCASHRTLVRVK